MFVACEVQIWRFNRDENCRAKQRNRAKENIDGASSYVE